MPFKSKAQQKFLYSHLPEVAEKFADHTPKKAYEKLPEHIGNPQSKTELMKRISHKFMRSKSVK